MDKLNELQSWWNDLPPETRAYVWDGGVAFAALAGGFIIGGMVARTLRGLNFDAAFGLSGGGPGGGPASRSYAPTRAVGLLVRLTVWAGVVWWFLGKYGRADLAESLRLIGGRVWALIAMLAGSLVVGDLVSRRVTDLIQGSLTGPNGTARTGAAPNRYVAGAVGAAVYVLVLLLALLVAADAFDWPLSRTAAGALWQLGQQLLTAGAGLSIAYLGAHWARELATPTDPVTPELKAGQYVGLALIGGAAIGGVMALLSGRGILIAMLALPILGGLLWLARDYIPDVMAGLKLRKEKVVQVWIEGTTCRVEGVGLLTSEVGQGNETGRVRNRLVLAAAGHGSPVGNRRW
jgi:hypothetical protein